MSPTATIAQTTTAADPVRTLPEAVEAAVAEFLGGLATAVPRVVGGLVFLVLAVVLVRVVMWLARGVVGRAFPEESEVYRQVVLRVISIALWFGVALSFLSVVGLEQIAAALGTASGFLALGVSYAVSGMLADAVAGIYLLRDPDFNPGDRVAVGDMTGVVRAVELRKSRFEVDGDTVVRANQDVEKRWTLLEADAADGDGDGANSDPDGDSGVDADGADGTGDAGVAAGDG